MKKNRKIDFTILTLTTILLVYIILTIILDQKKANWVCGPVLMLFEFVFLAIQIIICLSSWNSENVRTKKRYLFCSILIFAFITYSFINFNLKCS